MIEVPTQLATSLTADFEEGTWTFLMKEEFQVWSGEFAIMDKPVFDRLISERKEAVDLLKKLTLIQFDVDEEGEQKASIIDIMQTWGRVQEIANKLQL